MPVADVRVGDVVIVRPGERVPVDGIVVAGESSVDQAPVTGESWPAEKAPGDDVFAGTINGNGALEIEASRPAADSTLARIVRLVEQAQGQRAPVQTFRRSVRAPVHAGRRRTRDLARDGAAAAVRRR